MRGSGTRRGAAAYADRAPLTKGSLVRVPDLIAPLAGRWLRRAQADLDLLPHPQDQPRRTAAGPDADRVLVLGNGAAIGFGVRTHELALPGHLARGLREETGRGAIVDVAARRGLRVGALMEFAREVRLSAYDAVVVAIGATDAAALTDPARWRAGLERLLDDLDVAVAPGTVRVLLPVRPLQRNGSGDGPSRRLMAEHADRLDRVTAEVCDGRPGIEFVAPGLEVVAPRTPEDYARLAHRVSDVLAPRLSALAAAGDPSTARGQRQGAEPEVLRQAAVDRTGLVGTVTNPVLDRLLQQARDLFGVSTAAVTLIDEDRVIYKAALGTDATEVPRALAPCNRAIRHDGALVVPDLDGEPIAGPGRRFYAGYPLESPDGFRIGTLCILDGEPRRTDVDRVALMELAARVQAELWREIQHGPRTEQTPAIDTGSLRLPALRSAGVPD